VVSSVGIATDYRLDDRGSIPGRGRTFFCKPQLLDRLQSLPSLLPNGNPGLFSSGVKLQGREADQSRIMPNSRIVELYPNSPRLFHGVVCNYLRTGTILPLPYGG
jgi:hypothetical protein